jgi:mono/diheme cytochrome c family protein
MHDEILRKNNSMRNWTASAVGKSLLCLTLLLLSVAAMRAQSDSEKTYKAKCAACHGPDGSGDTVVGKKLGTHDFRSPEVQKESDGELTDIIAKGKNKMPAYEKSLKPDEIKGLVTYVRSFAAKK